MKRLTEYTRFHGSMLPVLNDSNRYSAIERLAAIEDILGDEYDLDKLREMVQVVRCLECVHYTDWGACGNPDNGWDAPPMGPEDFCSRGERR